MPKMNRREFLQATAAIALVAPACSPSSFVADRTSLHAPSSHRAPVPQHLTQELYDLIAWLRVHGWGHLLASVAGLQLEADHASLAHELRRPLAIARRGGFDDFGGVRAIQPGDPAMSLLYHALASPRVRLPGTTRPDHYPTLAQIDLLEDYIYACGDAPQLNASSDLVLAVFAYEYRPAFKTPHLAHADLVFSRTGVARIGDAPLHYDRLHRTHLNEPRPSDMPSTTAVTPARYGLFVARRVGPSALERVGDTSGDEGRRFLLPLRKVFHGDPLVGASTLSFGESHRNEKLRRLARRPDTLIAPHTSATSLPPFLRQSRTTVPAGPRHPRHDTDLVDMTPFGSSVCVSARPAPLVREARLPGTNQRVRLWVPPEAHMLGGLLSNRRYTTLKLLEGATEDALDYMLSDFVFGQGRLTTRFTAPRTGPMFINIRFRTDASGERVEHLGPDRPDFEQQVAGGGYWAALFEDSTCDGCVHVRLSHGVDGLPILPAFSVVTAPDFFPAVDPHDFARHDDYFLVGGTEILSGGRLPANPHVQLPWTDTTAFGAPALGIEASTTDTVTATISSPRARAESVESRGRGARSINTLPDCATNVFAPGWDVTYSGERGAAFFATFGLGSPFPEDVKLCAAANGMWPGSSPDAARTFQAGLDPTLTGFGREHRSGTAIPLLDDELGLHPCSPAVEHHRRPTSRGWDGEHGPFLHVLERTRGARIEVDFANVRAVDYVQNVLDERFDMSRLRALTSAELIERMEAIQRCLRALTGLRAAPASDARRGNGAGDHVRHTVMWLVSAERVSDWSAGAAGLGLPRTLFPGGVQWATAPRVVAGRGFLYVFAETQGTARPVSEEPVRLRIDCARICVCQVAGTNVAWVEVAGDSVRAPAAADWRHA